MRLSQVRLKIQFNSIPTSYNYERSGRTTPSPPHLPPPSGSTFRWPLDCMKMKKVPLYRLASRGGGGRARKRSKPRNLIQCRPHAQTQALAPGALEGRHSKTGENRLGLGTLRRGSLVVLSTFSSFGGKNPGHLH